MAQRLETLSLFLLILGVGLRPLISESYRTEPSRMAVALEGVAEPTPIPTLVFDLAILVAAAGWLISRRFDPKTCHRLTGLKWPTTLFAVAGIISCAAAADQRSAINATLDLMCQLVLVITLVQCLRFRWRRGLLLAVILASASVQAGKCLDDHFGGFDDTWKYYQEHKAAFWAAQDIAVDADTVELFERRMLAREASGFLPHSNVAGSYLVLCLIVAIGSLVAAFRRGPAPGRIGLGVAVSLTIGLALAVFTTKSVGALATCAGGLGLMLAWIPLRGWTARHGPLLWRAAWIGMVLVAAATIGYGVLRGRLPGDSLYVRWQYWTASASMFADHSVAGVGRENFGNAYLRYKTIESPEEVSNPHSMFFQFATEMGIVGLAALLAGCWLVSRLALVEPAHASGARAANDPRSEGLGQRGDLTRSRPSDTKVAASPHGPPALMWRFGMWPLALLAAILGLRLLLAGATDVNFLYYTTVMIGVIWLTAFIAYSYVLQRADDAMISAFTGVSLVAFLIHETVNFALFVPGSATTFCALVACWISFKQPDDGYEGHLDDTGIRPDKRWAWALATCLAGIVAAVFLALMPMVRVYGHLARVMPARLAPQAPRVAVLDSQRHLEAAIQTDPFDPQPVLLAIDWHLEVASQAGPDRASHLARAGSTMKSHEARLSRHIGFARRKRAVLLARVVTGDWDALDALIHAARDVLDLYPSDPNGHAALGDVCVTACESLILSGHDKTEQALRRLRQTLELAINSYAAALALDARRPEWEQIRGLRPRQREHIQQAIEKAKRIQGELLAPKNH